MANHVLTLQVSAATHRGYVRSSNEDAIIAGDWIGYGDSASRAFKQVVDAQGLLLAVADGLGGHRAGEVASRFLVDELLRHADPSMLEEDAFVALLRQIDADLRLQAFGTPSLQGMGSTLAAVYVSIRGLMVINVGDSRVYTFDDRDGLRQVSFDHVPRRAPLEVQPAISRRKTHAITQAFGGNASRLRPLRPHVVRLPPPRREGGLLLCSDGLSDFVSERALTEAFGFNHLSADHLVRQALEAGATDNVSAIVALYRPGD